MGWKDAPEVSDAPAWASAPVVDAKKERSLGNIAKAGIEGVVQQTKDLAGGLVRGAGSIGATILAPQDALNAALMRARGMDPGNINQQRRQDMTSALGMMGADTGSLTFGAGKLGGEIAGTAGVGSALAPAVARVAPSLAPAVASAGFRGASMPARVAGGAITGGASAGLVNPEDAGLGATAGAILGGLTKPVAQLGGAAMRNILGNTSGVGDKAISEAFKAGRSGGQAAREFTSNMRGTSSMDDVLAAAKQNLEAMAQAKRQSYQSGMQGIRTDKTVLDMTPIDNAVGNAVSAFTFKGQAKNPRAAKALEEVSSEVAAWRALDPAEFHTPEGLDALKQRIGGILESLPFEEKSARTAVNGVYNSIKSEINKQAPTYSKVMGEYSAASETIREIEKALSLGQKSQADTAMRKLQSLMRNNVNTSYGYRDALAAQLEAGGGQQIMPALAGQAMTAWAPRGLQRAGVGTGGAALALTGNVPAALGLGAISSPRLIGESAYLAGRASNPLEALLQGPVARTLPVYLSDRNN
jgi:hypothetical protein